jgi:hypothetical protein
LKARAFAPKGVGRVTVNVSKRALCVAVSAGFLGVATAGAFGGCTNNVTALAYTPITGVVIHSQDLVAGHGCGMAPDQVYAYVVVLARQDSPDIARYSTVVSCYTDGVLSNLPTNDDAAVADQYAYYLYIYAYNYASFPRGLACTPPITNSSCPGDIVDATTIAAQPDSGDAGIPPRYPPTWTTTCTAHEYGGEPMLATCNPLQPTAAAEANEAGPD